MNADDSPTEVPKQVCMTKDNVSLYLTSVIYYRITSPHRAAFAISNIRQALVERTQTTLRHVVGARLLQDVIERREEIATDIREIVETVAHGWGVDVESMLIKDIIFSQELQDSLSMAAQSKRTGEAKVIAARAEVESAKLMRQAADILSSAPAMQIRYATFYISCHLSVLTCNQLPRGHASNGQDGQLQGHLPAGHQPDRAVAARPGRE
jgi:erythrocyte band 7 integral membrane protein